jgi:chaperonin GroES
VKIRFRNGKKLVGKALISKEKPQKGEVVSVGLGKTLDSGEREPLDVKVGDVVLYAKYSGTDVKLDGQVYKILSVKDALAIIE